MPISNYKNNRAWSDKYMWEVKQILGPLLLIESTFSEDVNEACDLKVLTAANKKIAVRIRRPEQLKYTDQFTIRFHLPSGQKTEFAKIMEGNADLLFYAFVDPTDEFICSWYLIDLSVFRHCMYQVLWKEPEAKRYLFGKIANYDGSEFAWFKPYSFPKNLIITSVGA